MSYECVPADWSRYRAYLRSLAGAGIDPMLQSKVDPSDLVQQTLLQAYRALPSFRGSTDPEMMGWLRQILARTIQQAERDYSRGRRDVNRERAIYALVESSSVRLEGFLPNDGPVPLEEVVRSEQILRMCEAVESLPEAQRNAIQLHHWQGQPISEIAQQMQRTPVAVAGLLKRGLKTLRRQMNHEA